MDTHLKPNTLLRKLYRIEIFMKKFHELNSFLVTRAFNIDSKVDLFSNRIHVEAAIQYWKRLHPLLLCKIDTRNDGYYFVVASEETIKNLDNVDFLYFENDASNGDQFECWKYLFERETIINYNNEGLLWRMKIIFLGKCDDIFKYSIVFSTHHAITDGRNNHAIMLELLKLIEKTINRTPNDNLTELDVKLAQFEYNYPDDPRKPSQEINEKPQLELILSPTYLKNSIKPEIHKNCDALMTTGVFYKLNGDKFMSVDEIVKEREKIETGFRLFNIDANILQKLMQSCRKNNVKLTSCLDLVILMGILDTCKVFGDNGKIDCLDHMSVLLINMRPLLTPPLDSKVMGYWLSVFFPTYAKELENCSIDEAFWKNKFWEIVKTKCVELHNFVDQLKGIEFYKNVVQSSQSVVEAIINEIGNEKGNELLDFYEISNLGELKSCADDSCSLLKIVSRYNISSFSKFNFICNSHFEFCTVNKKLFGCFSYNKNLISEQVADYWFASINKIIEEKLIDF